MENVTEKIRKLLAKAESNNEYEASAALLKARALMAKYKIDESAVKDAAPRENKLNQILYDSDSFSTVRNTWFYDVARVIAENHCCKEFAFVQYGHKVRWIKFAGLDDDPFVAREIFSYAVDHIKAQSKDYAAYIRKRALYPSDELKRRAAAWEDSYAQGFAKGLAAKYSEQFKPDDAENPGECSAMALALVQPAEVKRFADSLHVSRMKYRNNGENANASRAGFTAGYTFNPTKQIAAC